MCTNVNINDLYLKIHENFDNGNIIGLLTKKEKDMFLDSFRLFKYLDTTIKKYVKENTRFKEDLKGLNFVTSSFNYIIPYEFDDIFFIKLKNTINDLVNDNEKNKVYNLTYDEDYFKYLTTLQQDYNKAIDKRDEYVKLGILPNYNTIKKIIKDDPNRLKIIFKYFSNLNKEGFY